MGWVTNSGLILLISPLLFSAVLGPILAVFIARYRHTPGAKALIALLLAASLWSAGYAAEIISRDYAVKLFWAKFQYFGIVMVPLAWFAFAMQYLGAPSWLLQRRRLWPLLGLIPGGTLLLVWTNELHRFVWQEQHLKIVGSLNLLDLTHGAWFWIYVIFGYTLMLLGTTWLISRLLGSNRLVRWQMGLAMVGAIVPWIGNLLYVTNLTPIGEIDWTPFGFIISSVLFSLSLFRFHMVKVVPVAHRVVFEELADSILVLDRQDGVIDLNVAARKLIQIPKRRRVELPLALALPELAGILPEPAGDREVKAEVTLSRASGPRCYEVHLMPLKDRSSAVIGRVLILHDIHERKQAQAQLEQAYAELEDRVAERTEALRLANQQLTVELEQRRLAEERFEDIIHSSPDAILVIDARGEITLANAQSQVIFGWPAADIATKHITDLIPERLRAGYQEQIRQFFAHPVRRPSEPQYELFGLRRDGSEFPAEVHLSPLKTPAGVLAACVVREISLRKQAEQEQADLLEQVQESHQRLRLLTARLEEVQEIERRQIAAELHDRVGQSLTALNLNLKSIQNKLAPAGNGAIQNRLVDSLDLVEETTRQVRNVMADLNPPLLDEYGLLPAIHWFGEKFTARTGIRVTFNGSAFISRLPARLESALFRIVQEALNNVAKHSQAAQVTITWSDAQEAFRMCLEDDGRGFDPAAVDTTGEQPHWGLLSMKERAAAIGGNLIVHSAPDKGTHIEVEIRRTSDGDPSSDRR